MSFQSDISIELHKQAYSELKSARNLYKSGENLYAIFAIHLAVEKFLKAFIAELIFKNKSKLDSVPKSHHLLQLAQYAKLNLTFEIKTILASFNDFNIQTRYPDDLELTKESFNKAFVSKVLKNARVIFNWLEKELK